MASRSSRTRRGTAGASSSRSAPPPANPFLDSLDSEARERYNTLSKLKIVPNRFMVVHELRMVGLKNEVWNFLGRVGWLRIVNIKEPCYKELLLEFLATFVLEGSPVLHNRNSVVRFRLGGSDFVMTVTEFAVHCGFYSEEEVLEDAYVNSVFERPVGMNDQVLWTILTENGGIYDPSRSKSTKLRSLALRYIHRFMSYSVTGRGGDTNGVVNQVDLFCLYAMQQSWQCNLGILFARLFHRLTFKTRGAVVGGSFVTRLAKNLGVLDPTARWTKLHDMAELGLESMRRIHIVEEGPNGRYRLVGQPDAQAPEAPPEEDDETPAGEQGGADVGDAADPEMEQLEADIDDPANHPSPDFDLQREVRALQQQQVQLRGDFETFRTQQQREMAR